MKFSYSWLKEFVPVKKSAAELAELLTMRSFEVERVEKIGNDHIFDIALPPNRIPDASGHLGMAREIAVLLRASFKAPQPKLKENKKKSTKSVLAVEIKDKNACRRYIGRVIEGVSIKDSPKHLQERLLSLGQRPINNVVDATNLVMLETGQPLHVFDLDKLQGGKIVVRAAAKSETMTTLDDQKISLTPDDLVIADGKEAIALAGVKGGKAAEVDLATTRLALEAANFNGISVRKTSKRVGIRTDASHRFEHDIHPDLAEDAMNRLAELLQDVAGGELLSGAVDAYPKRERASGILVDTEYANSLIGITVPPKEYERIITSIGCACVTKKKGVFLVTPPLIRRDLSIAEDIIEEVIRVYGYEHVPEILPPFRAPAGKTDAIRWREFFRSSLIASGFSEVYRYAFLPARDIEALGGNVNDYAMVENPLSPDFQYMVREPYENFFAVIRNNLRTQKTIDIFSFDRGFARNVKSGGEAAFHEHEYLTIASVSGQQINARSDNEHREELYAMKGALHGLLESAGIDDHWFDGEFAQAVSYPHFRLLKNLHPYRRAEIKVGDDTVGVFGEVHPSVLAHWKIDRRVFMAEFLFSDLRKHATEELEFRAIPQFPAIERDLSLLVPLETRIEEAQGMIENEGGVMLEDVDFMDEYMGEKIPEGMRSLTFRLVFRDTARTLQDKEVDEHMKKVLAAAGEKGWEVR